MLSQLLFLAVNAAAATAYATPAPHFGTFHVKQFLKVCDNIYPGQICNTTFNVTYDNSIQYTCSVPSTKTDYVICQQPSPGGVYMSASIKPTPLAGGAVEDVLSLKYSIERPGAQKIEHIGQTLISSHQPQNFDVAEARVPA